VAVEAAAPSRKRLRRTREEKRRIVEATFVPGASIARVAREHGVNANQVFQWRHEYRKGALGVRQQAQSKLLPVTVTAEPNSVTLSGTAPVDVLHATLLMQTCIIGAPARGHLTAPKPHDRSLYPLLAVCPVSLRRFFSHRFFSLCPLSGRGQHQSYR
jgi:transposase-like protein